MYISICVRSFYVDCFVSHLLLLWLQQCMRTLSKIHFPLKSTFIHIDKVSYLDKNTYGSYLNGDKTYLNSTLFRIHLHTVYSYIRSDAIYTTMVPV